MIRRRHPDGDLLVTQHEHALQAGRLAALHAHVPEPRAAFVRAVELHDSGWPLFDDRPTPLPDGRAPSIFDHPQGFSLPAWRRSVAIARAAGPLEALLVSGHFARFSEAFAAEQADRHAAWRLGIDPAAEEAGVALVGYCDAVSLRLLIDPEQRVNLPAGVRCENGRLDPWPFLADAIDDEVVGRLLPARRWKSTEALREAYSGAPAVPIRVSLRPF